MDHKDCVQANVFIWALDVEASELARLTRFLSAAELDRAKKFFRSTDGDRWIVARARMRELLASALDLAAEAIVFDTEAHGRPCLGGAAAPTVSFNLSHSDGFAALALSFDARVGVDIEMIRPMEDAEIAWALADEERDALATFAAEDRQGAFFRFWTLKEAFMKGTGLGAELPLQNFAMTLDRPGLVRWSGHDEKMGQWRFEEGMPAPGLRAAVAAQTEGGRLLVTWRRLPD